MAGGAGQYAGIVPLIVSGGLIGHGLFHVPGGVVPRQNRGHPGPGEAVVEALHRSEGYAEGGALRVEQPPAGIGLHHRDAHVVLLAQLVQLGALGVDAAQVLLIGFPVKISVQVVGGGVHIKGGVDAEQNHLHQAALHRLFGHGRVVGAHADMADGSLCLELFYIVQERTAHSPVPVGLGVHKVDHAQIYIIGLKPRQQILKGGPAQVHVPGADILPVLPGGAYVALDVPALPPPGQGQAQAGAHLGVGHPAVQDVDAQLLRPLQHSPALAGGVALHPLRAEADFADHQAGFAQPAVIHCPHPFFMRDGRAVRPPHASCFCKSSISLGTSMGFAMCPFMPASSAVRRSSSKALAVMAIMGMSVTPGRSMARMRRAAS